MDWTGLEIAIVGMAGRFPGAADVPAFWRNLLRGEESITFFSREELLAAGVEEALVRNPRYVRARGMLAGAEELDADFFHLSRREAELMDPQHRLFLECAWEALEDAGGVPGDRTAIGTFAGATTSGYLQHQVLPSVDRSLSGLPLQLATEKDYLCTRVAYKLDLRGPAITVQTACSTSLVAVAMACQSLLAGGCDLALAGGSTVRVPRQGGYLHQEGGIGSSDGHCRAFDAAADGVVGGEGVALVVLARLEDALAEGYHVHAVLKGWAVNNDGASKVGYTAPAIAGQAEVIRAALALAGVPADSIGYVEGHGTGTELGDPIEIAALTRAFRTQTQRRQFCALGSVKSNIGHLDAAAGVTGLIKATLAVEHGVIPPSLHFRAPNPRADLAASPFFVAATLTPWPSGEAPRRAAVSSFGIGGTNAHVVLEQAPPEEPSPPARAWQLLPLSAKDPMALTAMAGNLARHLEPLAGKACLADVAFTLQVGRRELDVRGFVIARDVASAARALHAAAAGEWPASPEAGADPRDEEPAEVLRLLDQDLAAAGPGTVDLLASLGRLWLAGQRIDWHRLHAGERRRRLSLPTYPFRRQRFWLEPAAAVASSLPLTEDQRELWETSRLGRDASVAFNLAGAFRLRGPLRRDALGRALKRLVERHEALRVTFAPDGESQTVAASRAVDLPVIDLAGTGSEGTARFDALLAGLLAELAGMPFDLARGPLMRCHLFRLEAELHVFALTLHHIVADGASFGFLLVELSHLYAAEAFGEPYLLPAAQSYRRFVAEVLALDSHPEMAAHEAFWLARFSPPPPPLQLPTDRLRPPVRTFHGDSLLAAIDPDLTLALRRLAARLGCTLPMLLLAALQALLHRLTGQGDLVVGLPAGGRPPDGAPLCGYFVSLLPLRSRASAATRFAALTAAARTEFFDAYEHRSYPLRRLVGRLDLTAYRGRPPLVAALFNFERPPGQLSLRDLVLEPLEVPTGKAEFELFWDVAETDRGLLLHCQFNTSLFDRATIERWQSHLESLLAHAVVEPGRVLGDLDLAFSPRLLPSLLATRRRADGAPEVAFLFPGQGAQKVGMGRELYRREAVFRAEVERCCEILHPLLGFDLREALWPERDDDRAAARLAATAVAQPALFVLEYALARLWRSWGVEPTALLGHSVGEYTAACLAGVFSLAGALTLVAERGALMQGLPPGAMLAVPLPEEEILGLLGSDLSLAAVNAPGRVVVSGPEEAVEALAERLRERGLPCRRLLTSHAFHSAAVEPILARFTARVREMEPKPPRIPFLSNVTGTWITAGEATDPGYWARHLRGTVRFAEGVRQLAETPARIYLEVGPGDTLSGLVRRILSTPGQERVVASLPREGEGPKPALDPLARAVGELRLAGVKVELRVLPGGGREDEGNGIRGRTTGCAERPKETARRFKPTQYPKKEIRMTAPLWAEPAGAPLREQIRSLFADLFGISREQIASDASFLELGADSLLLLRASQRIEETFGARIPFRRLVEELSNVEAVAAYLAAETEDRVEAPRLAPVPAPEPRPVPVPAGPSRAARSERSADLRALFSEQLRLLERQLDLLARDASPPAGPAPAPLGSPSAPLHLAPAFRPATSVAEKPAGPAFVPYRPIDRSPGADLTPHQREHLDGLIERLAGKTRRSKELTQAYRSCLANNRSVSGFRLLWKELVYPLVGHRGAGARIWDVDGNEYIDLTMGFGSLLFGHSPDFLQEALRRQLDLGIQVGPESETAGRVAELVRDLTGVERVTFSNSGTEAVMIALRLARAVTGRSRVALFAGAFHGTFDGVLVRGETGMDGRLRALPMAPGVPPHMVEDLLVLDYESEESLAIVEAHADELAAVLVEPVQSRRPELLNRVLLSRLRAITEKAGIALIFDEVVTGFRVHPGGVQALFGVQADLVTYGKAVANGLPIGIVAGKAKYLDAIDGGDWRYGDRSLPEAEITLFGGTFFRHPLIMAAALAVLERLRESPRLQADLSDKTERLVASLEQVFAEEGLPCRIHRFGSLFTFRFPRAWWASNLLFFHLLEKGIYIWEGRICYLSTSHTAQDLEQIVAIFRESVRELRQGGFLPGTKSDGGPRA